MEATQCIDFESEFVKLIHEKLFIKIIRVEPIYSRYFRDIRIISLIN